MTTGFQAIAAGEVYRHFPTALIFAVLWLLGWFAWFYYRQCKRGVVFPSLKSVRYHFHEGMVSGSSCKTWWTKLSGANNCLRVTVTDSEVWIRAFFPFNVLAGEFDLEHRIPLNTILSAEISSSALRRTIVLLDFSLPDGSQRRLKLRLKNPQAFLAALRTVPPPLPE